MPRLAKVYRVQDAEGRGPFRPGFSVNWADDEFAPGMERLPTFMEEFGWDLIAKNGLPGEHYGSAVRSLDALNRWFSPAEQARLAALAFWPVELKIDRILAESPAQLVFARRMPLFIGATRRSWASLGKIAA